MPSVPAVQHQLQVSRLFSSVLMDSYCFERIWENNYLSRDTSSKQTGIVGSTPLPQHVGTAIFSFVEPGKQPTSSCSSAVPQSSLRDVKSMLSSSPSLHLFSLLCRRACFLPRVPRIQDDEETHKMEGSEVIFRATISSLIGKNTDTTGNHEVIVLSMNIMQTLKKTAILQLASLHPSEIKYRWCICPRELSFILTCIYV